jgi:hypothetical protein
LLFRWGGKIRGLEIVKNKYMGMETPELGREEEQKRGYIEDKDKAETVAYAVNKNAEKAAILRSLGMEKEAEWSDQMAHEGVYAASENYDRDKNEADELAKDLIKRAVEDGDGRTSGYQSKEVYDLILNELNKKLLKEDGSMKIPGFKILPGIEGSKKGHEIVVKYIKP